MRIAIFLIAAVALLAGLWLGLRPVPPSAPAPAAAASSASADLASALAATKSALPPADGPKRFELRPVAAGMAAPVLTLRQGDEVELQVTSPGDDELHLHGYDLSLALRAGVPGTLRFRAEHAGRFDLELHHANAELAVLEVQPR